MELFDNALLGLSVALSWNNLLYCFLGVLIGTFLGVIPGIGVLASISLLFPITFHMEPTSALIMLAGIWYGTTYGGSTASVLLNVPGTPTNAVTCLDGYPMTKQGRGGVALLMTTIASLFGGTFGILLLMIASPVIAGYAITFGAPEYFSLMVLGLVAASSISDGSFLKGLMMVTLGIVIGTVGTDIYTGTPRFVFGILELSDGISLIALAMGVFGVAEVISSIGKVNTKDLDKKSVSFAAMKPTKDDMRRSWAPMFRGAGIGSFSARCLAPARHLRRLSPTRSRSGCPRSRGASAMVPLKAWPALSLRTARQTKLPSSQPFHSVSRAAPPWR